MKQLEALSKEEFLKYIEKNLDHPKHEELHKFHKHLRKEGVDSGTILGYLRKADKFLDEEGEIRENPENSSALKKYREFRQAER